MEAMRALKRRLSNVVYSRMLTDQKRHEATGPGSGQHRLCREIYSGTGSSRKNLCMKPSAVRTCYG
jgi:hypothetical protein